MVDIERVEKETDELFPCSLVEAETRHGSHTWRVFEDSTNSFACPGYGMTTVSYSEIDAYRQCPFKHKLAFIDRWVLPTTLDMSPLSKGTFWHKILETHYHVIKEHQLGIGTYTVNPDVLLELCMDSVAAIFVEAEAAGTDPELIRLAQFMYAGYIEQYGIDEDWVIVAVEHTQITPLWNADGTESWVRLKVKLDLVIMDARGRLWVVDHKSCSALPGDKALELDEQFGLYMFVMRRLGKPIIGAIHNAARTQMNKGDYLKPGDAEYKTTMKPQRLEDRFDRILLNRTDPELEMIHQEALATVEQMYSPFNRHERHTNPDTCKWRCSYTEECLFGRRQGDNAKTLIMLSEKGYIQDYARH